MLKFARVAVPYLGLLTYGTRYIIRRVATGKHLLTVTVSDMAHQLTAGICARIHDANNFDEALCSSSPTIQLLSLRKVAPASGSAAAVERYRIIISDGENFLQAMLATQLNSLVDDGHIQRHSIVVVEKFTCNIVQERR